MWLTVTSYFITVNVIFVGDPVAVHSDYIAIVISRNAPISPLSLITNGRLGAKVKKNILFCSCTNEDMLHYYTCNWSGIS